MAVEMSMPFYHRYDEVGGKGGGVRVLLGERGEGFPVGGRVKTRDGI